MKIGKIINDNKIFRLIPIIDIIKNETKQYVHYCLRISLFNWDRGYILTRKLS